MKALFIGGTGVISTAVSRLAVEKGWDLTLLNRGSRPEEVPGARQLTLDINDEETVEKALAGQRFDVAADFIVFTPDQAKRDIRLFQGRVAQYIVISSASAYQKPLSHPVITEATPLKNPYWEYSRNKIAVEEAVMKAHRESGFPVTIVRPSHTFCRRSLPVPVHGKNGAWPVVRRMMEGKPVLVPGDGSSLWAVLDSEDFAQAFLALMGNPHAIGQAVQITGEELLTWNQIMAAIAQAAGGEYKPCYVPSTMLADTLTYDFAGGLLGDKSNTVIFDNSLLHRLAPNYRQQKRFDESCRESVAYFLAHPELQQEDETFDDFCDTVDAIMYEAGRFISAL